MGHEMSNTAVIERIKNISKAYRSYELTEEEEGEARAFFQEMHARLEGDSGEYMRGVTYRRKLDALNELLHHLVCAGESSCMRVNEFVAGVVSESRFQDKIKCTINVYMMNPRLAKYLLVQSSIEFN
jgi:hypothetical protein